MSSGSHGACPWFVAIAVTAGAMAAVTLAAMALHALLEAIPQLLLYVLAVMVLAASALLGVVVWVAVVAARDWLLRR